MAISLYALVDIFAILVLATIIESMMDSLARPEESFRLTRVYCFALLTTACDLVWYFIDGKSFGCGRIINYLANGCYYMFTIYTSYSWLNYVLLRTGQKKISTTRRLWYGAGVMMMLALVITTQFTHLLFYIDEANHYQRGSFHIILMVLNFLYLIPVSIYAYIMSIKKENFINREPYRALSYYAVPPIIMAALQFVVGVFPLVQIGITLSALRFYLRVQSHLISLDPLTKLNNRANLVRYLSNRSKNLIHDKSLYFLMVDADHFKEINDKFGHLEGDKALIAIADALRVSCKNTSNYICRYGGDEFVIIIEAGSNKEVDELIERINANLDAYNNSSGNLYRIAVTVGYEKYDSNIEDVQSLIVNADKYLYKQKKANRAGL